MSNCVTVKQPATRAFLVIYYQGNIATSMDDVNDANCLQHFRPYYKS